MNIWENAVITTKGMALISKMVSGKTLNITRAVAGAGYVTPGTLQSQTAVSNEKQEISFRAASYPEEGKCALPCFLTNDGIKTAYTATQIGIYAEDPDDGEILYFIAQAPSGKGTEVPTETEMPGYSAEWTFYFKFGQADGVNVTVNPSNTVSHEEFNAHTGNKDNPHGVTAEQVGAVSKQNGGRIDGPLTICNTLQCAELLVEADGFEMVDVEKLHHENTQVTKFATFDKNNRLKYRTAEEVFYDLGVAGSGDLNVHIGDESNPHGVTAEQVGAAAAGEHNLKTYTNLSQIGLSDGATLSQVARKLPNGSSIKIYVITSANANLAPNSTNGWFEAYRPSVNHIVFQYTTTSLKRYIADALNVDTENETITNWSKFVTQGELDDHKQSASTITAGTFAGKVMANATTSADLSQSQVRNISAGTADLTAGSSSLGTGYIYFVYE